MKILVTGARGNLGNRIVQTFSDRAEIDASDLPEMDIADLSSLLERVRSFDPDFIVNAAAFTAVDRCEEEVDLAYAANAVGPRNLAIAAHETGARLVHFSTDFVFDGKRAEGAYREYDEVNPLSTYGKSKLAGESEVLNLGGLGTVFRLAWLYGAGGWNFVDWVVGEVREGRRPRIVTDQIGTPTWVGDVTSQVRRAMEEGAFGLYHCVNAGPCSRHDWACEAVRMAGLDPDRIEPIASKDFPQKAPRPAYSPLDNFFLRSQSIEEMRPWREALEDFLNERGGEN